MTNIDCDHRPEWVAGLSDRDWLMDGYPIRDTVQLEMWDALDWSRAYVDLGPSPTGNLGPYWHVPLKTDDTVHRLYPKVLGSKWAPVIRQAINEMVGGLSTDALQAKVLSLSMDNFELHRRLEERGVQTA